jgi:DNA-binding transcriptional MocR family regulator
LERFGLQAVEVATDPRTGIDLDALEVAIERHRPSAIWVMTNFQNPLGSSMPDEKKRALVEIASRHQVPLIEDDVYNELHDGDARPASTKAFDRDGWVLHCSSFSKTLAPGYRVGWVSAGRFTRAVAQQKLAASLATSIPVQLALANYLARGGYERHLKALRAKLRDFREAYATAIASAFPAGTRVSRPSGGYFLWTELPEGADALEISRRAMDAGISVAPGPMFSASGNFRNHLRINAGHPLTPRVVQALEQLGRIAAH